MVSRWGFFVEPCHRKVRIFLHLYGFTGPPLIETCTYGSFATLSSGTEALLVGCQLNTCYGVGCQHNTTNNITTPNQNVKSDKIFKLTWKGENLEFVELPQKLEFARTAAVAMLIPDSKTICKKGK